MSVIGVLNSPWAIIPERLTALTDIYSQYLRGETDLDAIEARHGRPLNREPQGYDIVNGIAIVPIEGVIAKKMNLFSRVSGGVSTQLVERDFNEAVADSDVKAIVLQIDSPGGSVDGTSALANTIFEARGRKPIYAFADGLMASAAVWIGSAADKVFAAGTTSMVGSIGVVTQHVDYSKRNRNLGVTVSEVYAGKYKRIASENQPLSDEGRGYLQAQVDHLYSIFVDSVAKHRGTSTDDVLERMADGRMFIGEKAADAGLIDGFATLDELVGDLSPRSDTSSASESIAVLTPEQKAKSDWDTDANLRAEFRGDFESYSAYTRNCQRRRVGRG